MNKNLQEQYWYFQEKMAKQLQIDPYRNRVQALGRILDDWNSEPQQIKAQCGKQARDFELQLWIRTQSQSVSLDRVINKYTLDCDHIDNPSKLSKFEQSLKDAKPKTQKKQKNIRQTKNGRFRRTQSQPQR